jgi:hypothetical protein
MLPRRASPCSLFPKNSVTQNFQAGSDYLASPYCRWEWEDYVRYEAMRQCLGEGVAPVFFVTLPDAADPKT